MQNDTVSKQNSNKQETRSHLQDSGSCLAHSSGHQSSGMPWLHWTQEKGYQSLTPGCLSPCSPPQGTRDKDGSGVLQQGLRFIVGDLKEHGWPAGAEPCSWSWPHSPQPPYINRDRLHRRLLQPQSRSPLVRGLVPSLALNPSQRCRPWASPRWPGSFNPARWGCCHPGSLPPPPALRSP